MIMTSAPVLPSTNDAPAAASSALPRRPRRARPAKARELFQTTHAAVYHTPGENFLTRSERRVLCPANEQRGELLRVYIAVFETQHRQSEWTPECEEERASTAAEFAQRASANWRTCCLDVEQGLLLDGGPSPDGCVLSTRDGALVHDVVSLETSRPAQTGWGSGSLSESDPALCTLVGDLQTMELGCCRCLRSERFGVKCRAAVLLVFGGAVGDPSSSVGPLVTEAGTGEKDVGGVLTGMLMKDDEIIPERERDALERIFSSPMWEKDASS